MTLPFRLLLIAASIATSVYFLVKIRRAKMRIEDAVFWLLLSLGIIALSLFPGILSFFTELLGIQSPVNFLFLVVIFLLLVRTFHLTLKVSMLDYKMNQMGQNAALANARQEESAAEKAQSSPPPTSVSMD